MTSWLHSTIVKLFIVHSHTVDIHLLHSFFQPPASSPCLLQALHCTQSNTVHVKHKFLSPLYFSPSRTSSCWCWTCCLPSRLLSWCSCLSLCQVLPVRRWLSMPSSTTSAGTPCRIRCLRFCTISSGSQDRYCTTLHTFVSSLPLFPLFIVAFLLHAGNMFFCTYTVRIWCFQAPTVHVISTGLQGITSCSSTVVFFLVDHELFHVFVCFSLFHIDIKFFLQCFVLQNEIPCGILQSV